MIKYVVGDATAPIDVPEAVWYKDNDPELPVHSKVIVHVCNDLGRWGAGFVKALSKRFDKPYYNIPTPEQAYLDFAYGRQFHYSTDDFRIGAVQVVPVEPTENGNEDNLWVANLIAQRGIVNEHNPKPVEYMDGFWLGLALKKLRLQLGESVSYHMPRIGCGLGGSNWETIEPIIQEALPDEHIVVYDLK